MPCVVHYQIQIEPLLTDLRFHLGDICCLALHLPDDFFAISQTQEARSCLTTTVLAICPGREAFPPDGPMDCSLTSFLSSLLPRAP